MDIDDILASVSGPRIPQRTLDLQALTRAWVAERTAPELLPYPAELVDRVMDRVRKQIETVEEMTGNMDPKSNFSLIVIQTELERFKFLVRSFLRARIAKIDKYPHHYTNLSKSSDPDSAQTLLSPTESQYLTHHIALLSHHYNTSFLASFPAQLQRLDDTAGGISMVDTPDSESAVFCRVLRDCGEVDIWGEDGRAKVDLRRGDVWVLRWSAVKERVVGGDVELI
ncbi:GINS complex subunit [Zalaria obscura]|uniref:GINS complex subunit n=1 Tax=Zalaria obscura TaxID=2024903 RepID=A0ACC3SBA5_9PEZI